MTVVTGEAFAIPRKQAKQACEKCPDKWKIKGCIMSDIEDNNWSRYYENNPPQCLVEQLRGESLTKEANGRKILPKSPDSIENGRKNRNGKSEGEAIIASKKNLPNSNQKGRNSGVILETKLLKLTKTEKEFLCIMADGIIDVKKLAKAHNCSDKDVYKYRGLLRKKGYIDKFNRVVENLEGTCLLSRKANPKQPPAEGGAIKEHQIRVHGQQWRIGILYKDGRYKEKIGKTIYDEGSTIYCGGDAVEVYGTRSTIADDVDSATKASMDFWTPFFYRLQNDLQITLVKPRAQNIKLVKQHFAEVGNELATECETTGEKIRVQATEDGKVWLVIDNSFNLRELETQHPQTAAEDMRDTVVPFMNNLRDKKPPLPSDVWEIVAEMAWHEKELGAGLHTVVSLLEKQAQAQKPNEQPKPPEPTEQQQESRPTHEHPMYG